MLLLCHRSGRGRVFEMKLYQRIPSILPSIHRLKSSTLFIAEDAVMSKYFWCAISAALHLCPQLRRKITDNNDNNNRYQAPTLSSRTFNGEASDETWRSCRLGMRQQAFKTRPTDRPTDAAICRFPWQQTGAYFAASHAVSAAPTKKFADGEDRPLPWHTAAKPSVYEALSWPACNAKLRHLCEIAYHHHHHHHHPWHL